MTQSDVPAVDFVKCARARLRILAATIVHTQGLFPDDLAQATPMLAWIMQSIMTTEGDLAEYLRASGSNPTSYADGRAVVSQVSLDVGSVAALAWHPDPSHPSNQPRVMADGTPLADGSTAIVIASGSGVLDVIRQPPAGIV